MSGATPCDTAGWLRAVADQLDRSAPAPLTVHLTLYVSEYETTLSEAERVAAVDGVASVLGMTARPSKLASVWEHTGYQNEGAYHLSVSTGVAGPQVCACGAACTHARPSAA